MCGARFLDMCPTECRDVSPRPFRAARTRAPQSLGAVGRPVRVSGSLPRVVEVYGSPLVPDLLSELLPLSRSAFRDSQAKRSESEGSEATETPARCSALLQIFNLPALPFRGPLLIFLPRSLIVAAPTSAASSPCAAPLTSTPNLPVAIFPPAALASVGYLSRARDSRVRVLDASSRFGCGAGDLPSVADSGCAGSRPPQGRGVAAGGASSGRAEGVGAALRSGDRGEGTEARSRATARREADGPLGPGLDPSSVLGRGTYVHTSSGSAAAGGKSVRNLAEGSAEPRGGVLAAPAASRGLPGPRSRLWRVLRASGAVPVYAAQKKSPLRGFSGAASSAAACSGLRHLGPFGPSSSIRGASYGFGIIARCHGAS